MKNIDRITVPTLLALLPTLLVPFASLAQGTATDLALIPISLAQHVATEHVHANNQPYKWLHLDHVVLYDVDGNPNGYALIFGKTDGRFNEPATLRQHITDRTAAQFKQGAEAQASDDNDLFAFDDLATVITGATTESPLILRHFRGAPEFWIEAIKQEASPRAGTSEAPQVVMVTPMDFRLVIASAKSVTAAAKPSAQSASLPLTASTETIAVHSGKTERISALRQQALDREARTRKHIESMTPEQRLRHIAAQRERKSFLNSQWVSKRREMEGANQSPEKQ